LEISSLPTRNKIPGLAFADNSLTGSAMIYNANCLPDLAGESYRDTLIKLHHELSPAAYLEIGTLTGGTLALSRSPSIAIDPKFQITSEVIGEKSVCLFYQLESDTFFRDYTPKALLGSALDFTFLDGMHRCEFLLRDFMNAERHSAPFGVIALHDCIPVEIPMTNPERNTADRTAQGRLVDRRRLEDGSRAQASPDRSQDPLLGFRTHGTCADLTPGSNLDAPQ
jgi:hypothetical protein